MKKNLKKALSLVLAFVFVLSLSLSASAAVRNSKSADIGVAQAKEAALAHFSLGADEVKFLEARKDYDDGVAVYEIEFCKPYEVKYSCEVVAANGRVRDAERDVARGFFDKIELFFEVFFSGLFQR